MTLYVLFLYHHWKCYFYLQAENRQSFVDVVYATAEQQCNPGQHLENTACGIYRVLQLVNWVSRSRLDYFALSNQVLKHVLQHMWFLLRMPSKSEYQVLHRKNRFWWREGIHIKIIKLHQLNTSLSVVPYKKKLNHMFICAWQWTALLDLSQLMELLRVHHVKWILTKRHQARHPANLAQPRPTQVPQHLLPSVTAPVRRLVIQKCISYCAFTLCICVSFVNLIPFLFVQSYQ